MNFKKGDTFHIIKGPGKPYKIHVIAVIKSDGNTIIVYKWYGRHNQWWHYEVAEDYLLEGRIESCIKQRKNNEITKLD